MKQLKKSRRPVVLTVKGQAAAVVQDAAAISLRIAGQADAPADVLHSWRTTRTPNKLRPSLASLI